MAKVFSVAFPPPAVPPSPGFEEAAAVPRVAGLPGKLWDGKGGNHRVGAKSGSV